MSVLLRVGRVSCDIVGRNELDSEQESSRCERQRITRRSIGQVCSFQCTRCGGSCQVASLFCVALLADRPSLPHHPVQEATGRCTCPPSTSHQATSSAADLAAALTLSAAGLVRLGRRSRSQTVHARLQASSYTSQQAIRGSPLAAAAALRRARRLCQTGGLWPHPARGTALLCVRRRYVRSVPSVACA